MIPLPAEVKECLQKSIRLTSYTPFNQLIRCISVSSYMLTRRFPVLLNRSLVGRLGIVIEKTNVAYLRSFPCAVIKKTFEVTCGDGRVKSIPNAYLGIGKRVPQIVRKTQITRPVRLRPRSGAHISTPRGTPIHKRARMRAGSFENDLYKIIKGT